MYNVHTYSFISMETLLSIPYFYTKHKHKYSTVQNTDLLSTLFLQTHAGGIKIIMFWINSFFDEHDQLCSILYTLQNVQTIFQQISYFWWGILLQFLCIGCCVYFLVTVVLWTRVCLNLHWSPWPCSFLLKNEHYKNKRKF